MRKCSILIVVAMAMLVTGCGPSKELQALQQQYANLQATPVMPVYTYTVSTPFVLMGKPVATSKELESALSSRPSIVVASIKKVVSYGDLIIRSDMQKAGYAFVGQQNRGKYIELTFKDDSASAMQSALAQRQQQIAAAQSAIQMQKQDDASKIQTGTIIGGFLITAIATVGGILAAQ